MMLFVSAKIDGVVYVNAACVSELKNGRSWNTAYSSIQDALDAVVPKSNSEIWVAQGKYTASNGPVVYMVEGIDLYGGFAGTELYRDARSWSIHRTEIDGEDQNPCVIGASSSRLDGFVIRRGVSSFASDHGSGGGIYNDGASPVVANCILEHNEAVLGGAIANVDASAPIITNSLFVYNAADSGGAIYNSNSSPLLVNCTFSKNNYRKPEGSGGAVYSTDGSHTIIVSCVLWDNVTEGGSGEISNIDSSCSASYSCVQGPTVLDGEGNINESPVFVDSEGDYRLSCSSPCIDSGGVLEETGRDLLGNPRLVGLAVDMGAYEYAPDPFTPPVGTITINNDAESANVQEVTLSMAWTDCGGFGVSRMRFSNDGATWSSWEPLSQSRAYVLPSGDGYKTVRVQYLDKVGNRSAAFSDFIRLDTTPPTGSILINNNRSATNNSVVALKLGWSDGGGSGVTRMRFSDDGATWTSWIPLKTTLSYAVPVGDGYKTIRVQYRDAANNTSATFRDFIRLDTKPPTGSILINGGDSSTRDRWVSLALSWADPGGAGASRMRFSIDGATWSGWEPLAATKAYQLPFAPGYYTVRVTYRDGADNISERFSDYIRLDVPS